MIIIILAVILGGVLFALFTSIVFELDSTSALCQLRWVGICSIMLVLHDDQLAMRLSILGFQKTFNLFASRKKSERSKKKKVKKNKKGWRLQLADFRRWKQFGRSILGTFQLDQLYLNLDTGDWALNSMLFPIAFHFKENQQLIRVNYQGNVELKLKVRNRLASILRVAIIQGIPIIIRR